ncbi:hypothetical protein FRC09_007852 [Ceratobasidium sp. 395]|nr:hypothetical protein FRC09_007852 [Ceratobasidium sp. 395]
MVSLTDTDISLPSPPPPFPLLPSLFSLPSSPFPLLPSLFSLPSHTHPNFRLGNARYSTLNQEPVALNQNPAQGIVAGNPVVENAQNPALPLPLAVMQGENQAALNHMQSMPPAVVAAPVANGLIVMPPNSAQPAVPVPALAPAPVVMLPAVNGNPIHPPLMRTLYGFLDIPMEDEHGEDGANDGA